MTAVIAAERDLVEHYFDQPWSDGLPVVPPTPARIAAVLDVLGENPTNSWHGFHRAGAA